MYEKRSTNLIFIPATASILYNNWWEQFGVADTLLALFSTSAFAIHMKDFAVSSFSSPDSSLRLHLYFPSPPTHYSITHIRWPPKDSARFCRTSPQARAGWQQCESEQCEGELLLTTVSVKHHQEPGRCGDHSRHPNSAGERQERWF